MTPDQAAAAARQLWEAWSTGRQIAGFEAGNLPTDLEGAYAIQSALDALAGKRVGWKLAATAAAGQASLGVERPLVGPLYEGALAPEGSIIDLSRFRMGLIEAEFGFRMDSTLDPTDAPYDRAEVAAAIGAMIPAFELPASRFADHRGIGAPQLTADAACAGTVVLGQPVETFDRDALADSRVTLTTSGATARGCGRDVLGDPIEAVRWLADELAAYGRTLVAGDIVITGAAALVAAVQPGPATAGYGALGSLRVELR